MRLTIILFLSFFAFAKAQESKTSELFLTLKKNDSLLFNVSFNNCDHSILKEIASEDFEFYHDKGGITSNKADFIKSIRENICQNENKLRRALIDSSLQVYRLEDNGKLYGAIQEGNHLFYATPKNGEEYLTGSARFIHLWILENDRWKLKRVLSYDHGAGNQYNQ